MNSRLARRTGQRDVDGNRDDLVADPTEWGGGGLAFIVLPHRGQPVVQSSIFPAVHSYRCLGSMVVEAGARS